MQCHAPFGTSGQCCSSYSVLTERRPGLVSKTMAIDLLKWYLALEQPARLAYDSCHRPLKYVCEAVGRVGRSARGRYCHLISPRAARVGLLSQKGPRKMQAPAGGTRGRRRQSAQWAVSRWRASSVEPWVRSYRGRSGQVATPGLKPWRSCSVSQVPMS
ncbi:Piso0_000181 [Millerozyma farinosa CBS 7064]|uniref:Piso0_000181 protein n=1 Tax=Pichia sorbitophila (strain ATCC MYA-4447 / BCRC 22081 / CBS 7064 / NBRC 10061 / NRRL Y-12695) TaxID=559304 RepID=G8YUR1_PICSO|nr:Piso0_000181 [Millerozyma farinosa CBS 7064]